MHRVFWWCMLSMIAVGSGYAQPRIKTLPEWARGIVWYRIIPDRFYNADSANDPRQTDIFPDKRYPWELSKWTANWYDLTISERLFNASFYPNALLRHYGGDIEGVKRKLDYLQTLGVNAVIMTPPFEANSAHKYDIVSFHHIDHHFGPYTPSDTSAINREAPENPRSWCTTSADRAFFDLLAEMHRRGMKLIIDVQFAHAGVNFWAFKDLLQKQETSAFGGWFTVDEWDLPETPFKSEFRYKSMWGIQAFPEFRKDTLGLAPGLKDYVFASVKRWMDPDGDGNPADGVDGWRIELAGELGRRFWFEFMSYVNKINPNALILGGRVDDRPVGTPFDLEDNDLFPRQVSQFFLNGSITPTQIDDALGSARSESDFASVDAHINRIDNHETDRIASMCVNPSLPYDERATPQKEPGYLIRKPNERERGLQRLLILFQFTVPGSPAIYYGDEAGMWGGDDPDCRKPMTWPDMHFKPECSFLVNGDTASFQVGFDSTIFRLYKQLIDLRHQHLALRQGSLKTLVLDDMRMVYAYERHSGADRVFIVFNAGDTTAECRLLSSDLTPGVRLEAPLERLSFFYEKDGLDLILPPRSGTILIPRI
jgi:cyclomaltodextrinase / maltogenic alpha-amylase / neopullulanase